MKAKTLLASASLALTAGCSSTNPYVENRLVLEDAMTRMHAGELEEATFVLEELLRDTSDESREFALQRFFAAYLLTRSHTSAGTLHPFLQEPVTQSGRFDVRGSEGTQPSRIGHLMAMTYHSSRGLSWYGEAHRSPHEFEGEAVLPGSLESVGAENALAYMNLSFLAVHSELNFQDRIEEILAAMPELVDLERCEALMDEVELQAELRPWVYRGVFEHQKRRDEPNAYRFAIRARESGKTVPAFGDELCGQIAGWITGESRYRFVSPANQPFDPALEGCTVTGTPNLTYEAILKEQ